MASEPEVLKTAEVIPLELKQEPRSKGISTPRKKKPKELAVPRKVLKRKELSSEEKQVDCWERDRLHRPRP